MSRLWPRRQRPTLIAFLTGWAVADGIIDRLKLSFVAPKPPQAHIANQEVLRAAETAGDYFF